MENRKYTIYQTTNLINNMIYIGCHALKIGKDTDSYMGSGTNIVKAIYELGKHNFKKEILFIFDNKEDMLAKERELVNEEFIARNDTYNIILGGGTFYVGGCVVVKDIHGNSFMVHKTDQRFLTKELVGITAGFVPVIDNKGRTFQVPKNDPNYINQAYQHVTKGRVTVKNVNTNETLSVYKNDPRLLTNELVSINKNKIPVIDKDGNCLSVDRNHPKYLSGEYKHNATGYVTVKDVNGKTVRVLSTDERYLNGELVGINKNKQVSDETRKKQSKSHTGKIISDETKIKMSLAQKGIKKDPHTDEHKINLSLKLKGRKCIHKNDLNKKVFIDDLDKYLNEGWSLGKSPGSR